MKRSEHWLEVGNDRMAYRLLRGSEEYPGFEAVLEKSLEILKDSTFSTFVRLRCVGQFLATWTSSRFQGRSIELDDYFRLRVNLPEDPFGPLGGFAIHFVLPPTTRLGQAAIGVHDGAERGKTTASHFRMRWQSFCDGIDSLDNDGTAHRLTVAHEHLVKCFLACFTEKGLGLFNPTGSE